MEPDATCREKEWEVGRAGEKYTLVENWPLSKE